MATSTETEARASAFRRLFTERTDSYVRFIRAVGYPPALRAYFGHCALLRPDLRILDAGCGTGVVSLGLRDALLARGLRVRGIDAFDLTPAMLERYRQTLERRCIPDVRLAEADVLAPGALPADWNGYDLVVSASMLEYLPRPQLPLALAGLRARLADTGTLVLFITRSNWVTKPLIGRWWRSNLYTRAQLREAFGAAGFATVAFRRFPRLYRVFDVWGHIVEARGPTTCDRA